MNAPSLPPRVCLLALTVWLAPFSATADIGEATDAGGTWSSAIRGYTGEEIISDAFWMEQTDMTLDGVDAAEGRLDGPVESWIETTVTGPSTLYFSYRVKDFWGSYSGNFTLMVDGASTVLSESTGTTPVDSGWKEAKTVLSAGAHTVRWKLDFYRGNTPVRAYVDQVWTDTDPRPRLPPIPVVVADFNTPFDLDMPVISPTPATLLATGLPPGLTVDPSTFKLSGTPTAAGRYESTFTLQNSAGQHISKVHFDVHPGTTTIPEALDATTLDFAQAAGSTIWAGATGLGHDGVDAARATLVPSYSPGFSHPLTTTLEGPGILSFWYQTDELRSKYDGTSLGVYLGSITPESLPVWAGAESSWTQVTLPIPPGPRKVSWAALRWLSIGSVPQPVPLFVDVDGVKFTRSIEPPPPQPTFSAWMTAWELGDLPPSNDDDGDGLSLLMEYATGGSPYAANLELLPTSSVVDGHLTLNFPKASSPTDLIYFVQGNRSLVPNAWTTSSVEVLDEDGSHILARSKKPVTEEPNFHMRVRVLLTP